MRRAPSLASLTGTDFDVVVDAGEGIGGVFGAGGCCKVVGGLGGNFAVGIWRMSIWPIAL